MRQAATIDLFDRCGFGIVPPQVWRFVDERREVDIAVADFLLAIGADVAHVRAGDPHEVERVNDVLDLLVEIENAFERLAPEALSRVEDALFARDYEKVRTAARTIAIYEAIVGLAERWPPEDRLGSFNAFLSDVKAELADPLSSAPGDAEAAEQVAADMASLMDRFIRAQQSQGDRIEHFRVSEEWRSWPEASAIESEIVRFAELCARLRSQSFSVTDASAILDVLEQINASLEAEIEKRAKGRSGRRGSDRSGKGRRSTTPTELEVALSYFGFAKDTVPTIDEFKKRKRKLEKENYPPPAGMGSEELFKIFGQHRDVLKRHFGYK